MILPIPLKLNRSAPPFPAWASLATHCSRAPIEGFPFANVFSVSDGASLADSSGNPYFYLTPLELSVRDLKEDDRDGRDEECLGIGERSQRPI